MVGPSMVDKVAKIWLDGELVDWDKAQVHLLTHTLHYGFGVFEGIRCYELKTGGSGIFRLREHLERLVDSAKILTLEMPYDVETLTEACLETVRVNKLGSCYLRPIAFLGDAAMGLGAMNNPTRVAVVAWNWGAYLGEEGLKKGIRAKVSSFQRTGVNAQMAKSKAVGHYVNSILAKREALTLGFDEAIMLDAQGYVCEASGENIFLLRQGKVVTPPLGISILGGITRETVLQLIADLGLPVEERLVSRDELYIADEVFMCGTAAEVTPVREVDGRQVGAGTRGPVTARVQEAYFQAVSGEHARSAEWIAKV